MRIIQHTKPKLGKVTMVCDKPIDPKLEMYEAVKSAFSTPNFTIFSGAMGTGKSTVLIGMLKTIFRKCFHDIFCIIPEISLHSISERDNVFSKYLDEEHLFHSYDVETLENIYEKVLANAKENYYSMLIIDDFGVNLRDRDTEKVLNKMIIKMRHLKLGAIFVLCQNYFQLGMKLREVASNIILFPTSKGQNYKLFREQFHYSEEQFKQVIASLKGAHDWLLLDLKHKRLFNNDWDEIVFDDKDDEDEKNKSIEYSDAEKDSEAIPETKAETKSKR